MLSTAAWNAFLKTLEEPPPHVKFIFATTEVHKVPVTILSRCQRYDFKLIAHADDRASASSEVLGAGEHRGRRRGGAGARARGGRVDARRDEPARSGHRLQRRRSSPASDVTRVLGVADRKILHELAAALVAGDAAACLGGGRAARAAGLRPARTSRRTSCGTCATWSSRRCAPGRAATGPALRELLDLADEEIARRGGARGARRGRRPVAPVPGLLARVRRHRAERAAAHGARDGARAPGAQAAAPAARRAARPPRRPRAAARRGASAGTGAARGGGGGPRRWRGAPSRAAVDATRRPAAPEPTARSRWRRRRSRSSRRCSPCAAPPPPARSPPPQPPPQRSVPPPPSPPVAALAPDRAGRWPRGEPPQAATPALIAWRAILARLRETQAAAGVGLRARVAARDHGGARRPRLRAERGVPRRRGERARGARGPAPARSAPTSARRRRSSLDLSAKAAPGVRTVASLDAEQRIGRAGEGAGRRRGAPARPGGHPRSSAPSSAT